MTRNILTHSVFVGAYPDPEAEPAFDAVQRSLRVDGVESGFMPFDRLHLSLIGLGDALHAPGPRWVDNIARILDRVRLARFKISLNTLGTFHNTKRVRPVVLTGDEGVIGVSMLCGQIGALLRDEDIGHRAAAEPHVTVAWSDIIIPNRHVEPVSWTVREFVLVDSLQGAGRHEILDRWTLRGTDEDRDFVDFGPLFGPNVGS